LDHLTVNQLSKHCYLLPISFVAPYYTFACTAKVGGANKSLTQLRTQTPFSCPSSHSNQVPNSAADSEETYTGEPTDTLHLPKAQLTNAGGKKGFLGNNTWIWKVWV